ncbi:hypothetical protein niasHS_013840 [Heterodera schachtii]|uniref:Uncharacterized protein n=1 Tax=Heterodera schachtii TaxID=97005 RepID=A0ABD2IVD8_HETSC
MINFWRALHLIFTIAQIRTSSSTIGNVPIRAIGNISFGAAVGNGPATAVGNSQNADKNNNYLSANTNQNGPTDALGNGPADAVGTTDARANTNQNGSTDALGNGPADAVGTTDARANTNQNVPTDALGNGPADAVGTTDARDNNNVPKKRKQRETRLPPPTFPLRKRFIAALLASVEKESAKKAFSPDIKQNIEEETGGKTDQTEFVAENSINSSEICNSKCPECGWFDCHLTQPLKKHAPGDNCCYENFELQCCKGRDVVLPREKLVYHGRSKCFLRTPFCDEHTCVGEMTYYVVKKKTDDSVEINSIPYEPFPFDPRGCVDTQNAFVGERLHQRMDYQTGITKTVTELSFFTWEKWECSPCWWGICTKTLVDAQKGIEEFVCTCCNYEEFALTRWKWTDQCHYQADLINDLRCPKCNWMIRYSDDAFSCCDKEQLKNCTDMLQEVPADIAKMMEKIEKKNFTEVSYTISCEDLVKEKCPCGWANCKKRRGRAKNICCELDYDMVCCVGEQSKSAAKRVANDKTSAVFVLLLIASQLVMLRNTNANL